MKLRYGVSGVRAQVVGEHQQAYKLEGVHLPFQLLLSHHAQGLLVAIPDQPLGQSQQSVTQGRVTINHLRRHQHLCLCYTASLVCRCPSRHDLAYNFDVRGGALGMMIETV